MSGLECPRFAHGSVEVGSRDHREGHRQCQDKIEPGISLDRVPGSLPRRRLGRSFAKHDPEVGPDDEVDERPHDDPPDRADPHHQSARRWDENRGRVDERAEYIAGGHQQQSSADDRQMRGVTERVGHLWNHSRHQRPAARVICLLYRRELNEIHEPDHPNPEDGSTDVNPSEEE